MDPTQVWRVPPAPLRTQPPLTDELLETTERQLAVRLPESLVRLLRFQNGGVLQVCFPDERNYNTTHHLIRGIGPRSDRIEKAAWWHDDPDFPSRPPEAEWVIPFDGEGHWDLCLDYRRSSTDLTGLRTDPGIVVIDSECDPETFVAGSFDEYLSQLVPVEDY
ncbi:SMI1/KNR4 family protein [Mycobacteroides chelonae]|uniref:SMI1/KNR4 family protein n=1 Tax=Mycobacteroides chelonae TaxID=1774 RepID=UPI0004AA44FC|nr:SMI1/KNR4 family protein [Mycobacteroides chelonae]MBF9319427.1 SMI1/KNR4 family protein [Mycobacteroides chelonae]OHT70716.1 SMI1/KNR4 family protein [Mycobacteroides chelonae]OHT71645.1 SMI1/KNR4 family protein [Mycobacteroides chelonae]OHT86153.1 SMI1/KNR4 family protein [Mycobacteroides chelonae]